MGLLLYIAWVCLGLFIIRADSSREERRELARISQKSFKFFCFMAMAITLSAHIMPLVYACRKLKSTTKK